MGTKPASYCSPAMLSMLRLYAEGNGATIDKRSQPMTHSSLVSRGWIKNEKVTQAGLDYLAGKK